MHAGSIILLSLGVLFLFLGAVGIVRFPDCYTRMHAAGKCDTLGALLVRSTALPDRGLDLLDFLDLLDSGLFGRCIVVRVRARLQLRLLLVEGRQRLRIDEIHQSLRRRRRDEHAHDHLPARRRVGRSEHDARTGSG